MNGEQKAPNQGEALAVPIPPVRPIPPTLDPLTAAVEPTEKPSLADRIRAVWSIVEAYTEELVRGAEVFFGPQTGAEKKDYVTTEAMKLLRELEKWVNLVPDWIEPLVMRSIEWGLSVMIERIVRTLKNRGWAR